MVAGRFCSLIFFDSFNPKDCLVTGVHE
jgi:hypothetical protein